MINLLGKISLLALYLSLSAPLFAQEIFENEQGKLGYKNEMDKIVLAAEYDGMVRVEIGFHSIIFFAKKDPKNPSDAPAFLDYGGTGTLAAMFSAGYLYGCMVENSELAPYKRTDCRYRRFEAYSSDGMDESEFLAAYDGEFYTFFISENLGKPLGKSNLYRDIKQIFNGQINGSAYFLANQHSPQRNVIEVSIPYKKKPAKLTPLFATAYDSISPILVNNEAGYFIVGKNGDLGIADLKGKVRIAVEHNYLQLISEYEPRFICSKHKNGKKQSYLINASQPERKYPLPYIQGIEKGLIYEEREALVYQADKKVGMLIYTDEDPQAFIPAEYDYIGETNAVGYFEASNEKGLDIYNNEGKKYSIPNVSSADINFFGLESDLLLVRKNVNQVPKGTPSGNGLCVWDKTANKMLIENVNYLSLSKDKQMLTYKTAEKDEKTGYFLVQSKMLAFAPVYDYIQTFTVPNSDGNGGSLLAIVSQEGYKGVVAAGAKEPLLGIEFYSIQFIQGVQPFFVVGKDLNKGKANEEAKIVYGIINLRGEQVLPCEYEQITTFSDIDRYIWLTQKSGTKAYDVRKRQFVPQLANANILSVADSAHWNIREGEKLGKVNINSLEKTFDPSINNFYTLKWKQEIGLTSFRTNIILHNGLILAGSNGRNRAKIDGFSDDFDGLYLINPKNGDIIQQLATHTGDDDVNGAAAEGNNLYFGGDAQILSAYEWDKAKKQPLKKRWELNLGGEIEGSPALADLNGDGFMDVVAATESPAKIFAINGKTGAKLWEYASSEGGYFMATPALADLNGDKIPEVLIGLGGGTHFFAINGKNGAELWKYKTLSTAGFVSGSAIHSSATVLIDKKGEISIAVGECYGIIHFLDKNGKLKKYIIANIGLFSTPVFSPQMTVVSGSSWWGNNSDGVNICLAGKKDSWQTDESGWEYIENEKYYLNSPSYRTSSSAFVADILSQKNSQQLGIADELGNFILIDEQTGEIIQRFALPAGVEAPIFVGDVDNDGRLEMLIAGLDGFLYCYATKAPASNGVYWGQFRANNQNTGILSTK